MEYARWEFTMSKPDSKGVSLRKSLESVQKFAGIRPPELDQVVELPPLCIDWWLLWLELDKGRQTGQAIMAVTWSDMEAWARLTRRKLSLLDVEAIRAVDCVYVSVMNTKEADHA